MSMATLRSAAREVLLIVLGILIAFGLDASWTDRNRRATEKDLLRGLEREMRYNIATLDEADALRAASLEAARALFARTGPEAEAEAYSDVEALLLRIAEGVNTFEPRTGTVNSIIQAGKLDLIRSDPLQTAIASWEEQLRDVREEEDRSIENITERFWPYMAGRIVFPSAGSPWEGAFDAPTTEALLRDPAFAQHVAHQMHRIRLTMDDAADLRDLIQHMLRLIDEEFGRGSPYG
jgi:hypothetical protein